MVEPAGPSFTFEGRRYPIPPGGTVLEALAADGLPSFQRSPRYHRPRAPLCGLGHCTGCLVRVGGRPNVRACRYTPADGDVVSTRNAWPSRRFDLLAAFDLLFPSGIDTLRGFRRPAWARGLYQAVVRRLAGFDGPPSPDAASGPVDPPTVHRADVVVVGAGRAGRAVAERLVAGGRAPLLLDRGRSAPAIPGAELLPDTTVTFLPPPGPADPPFSLLGFTEPARGLWIRAREVVVAVGSYDAALLFGSNDRPGVLTADAAFALDRPGAAPAFRAGVVFGAGPRARAVVERMGDRIEALIAPGAVPPELVRACSDAGIDLHPRSLLLAAHGRRRVRAVDICARARGPVARLPCDAVVLAHRRLPHVPILFQAGARMQWRPEPGAYFPVADPSGRTTVPGLWVAGSVAGPSTDPAADGDRVARHLLAGGPAPGAPPASLPSSPAETPPAPPFPGEMDGYYRELLRLPRRGRWVACPCEDVLLEELEAVPQRGYRGVEVAKRYSGLGTGLCQGRYCLPDALLVLSILEGRPPADVGYITQRPPVVPTPLSALAALDPIAATDGGP